MAFIPKGGKWPNTAEEYPRHPDWLTIRQAAELLGCTIRAVEYQVYNLHTLSPVLKRWRHGLHMRHAWFFSRYEIEQLRIRRASKRKPPNPTPRQSFMPDAKVVAVNPLRQWRKEQGLKAADLAAQLGVSEFMVAGWEHGRSDPDVALMNRIATLLDVDLEDLKMRWAAWRILMLAPLPKEGRIALKLNFKQEPSLDEPPLPDEAA